MSVTSRSATRRRRSIGQRYVCSANASRKALSRANEILCYRLDGSLNILVVAPNLTSLDAAGGEMTTTRNFQRKP
jgi:hypothetical protein